MSSIICTRCLTSFVAHSMHHICENCRMSFTKTEISRLISKSFYRRHVELIKEFRFEILRRMQTMLNCMLRVSLENEYDWLYDRSWNVLDSHCDLHNRKTNWNDCRLSYDDYKMTYNDCNNRRRLSRMMYNSLSTRYENLKTTFILMLRKKKSRFRKKRLTFRRERFMIRLAVG